MILLLMDKILHDPKDPKLWELRYIPILGNAGFCPSTVVLIPIPAFSWNLSGNPVRPELESPNRPRRLTPNPRIPNP